MDKSSLINNLNRFFCDTNRIDKRYSKAWLSEVDFGGLYYSADSFVLNVVAEHEIDNRNQGIKEVINLLSDQAKDELQFIWRVVVYNPSQQRHYENHDLLVYSTENIC